MKWMAFVAAFVLLCCPAYAEEGELADLVSGMGLDLSAPAEYESEYYTETETEEGILCTVQVDFGEHGGFVRAGWLVQDGVPLRQTVTVEIRTGRDGRDPVGKEAADALTLALTELTGVYTAHHGVEPVPVFLLLLPSNPGDTRLEDDFLAAIHGKAESWLAQNEWTCVLVTDDQVGDMMGMGGVLLLELEDGALEANTRGGNAAMVLQRLEELPEEYAVSAARD